MIKESINKLVVELKEKHKVTPNDTISAGDAVFSSLLDAAVAINKITNNMSSQEFTEKIKESLKEELQEAENKIATLVIGELYLERLQNEDTNNATSGQENSKLN